MGEGGKAACEPGHSAAVPERWRVGTARSRGSAHGCVAALFTSLSALLFSRAGRPVSDGCPWQWVTASALGVLLHEGA